ncbi:MAG: hypothetical protein Kow00109_17750 [Acidobacteriota bacterium]
MNWTRFALRQPYVILALCLVVVALGMFSFFRTPTDLFPDVVPPQVLVITFEPGASAQDIADNVTEVLEKELNTLAGVQRILSSSRDEVSSINVQFVYEKPVGEAVVEVQNAVARVRGALPRDIQEPRIFRVTDATRPLVTVAVRPKPGSLKSLSDVRLLAENQLQDYLLAVPGIADVDIFGGHQPEITVRVDRNALAARGLNLETVVGRIVQQNVSGPAGVIYGSESEYLVRVAGQFWLPSQIADLVVGSSPEGRQIRLRELAKVGLEEADPRSIYHGNGEPAVALNLLRPDGGNTIEAIRNAKAALEKLRGLHPDLEFQITDDQQPIIDINVHGMRASLWQAVALTVLMIFLFLADTRAALIVGVSIPLSFLASLVILWFSPFTLNMVTLSGLIIAVGMVVDASIVVLENIYRHYAGEAAGDIDRAARRGAGEIALAITAGMLTTVIVLIPVMFTRGFTARLMVPLNLMIVSTLVASLLIALSVVPLLATRVLRRPHLHKNLLERAAAPLGKGVDRLAEVYVALVAMGLRHRAVALLLMVAFFALTMRFVRPLLGTEEMPPMDTGIAIVEFDTPASTLPETVEEVLREVERIIYATPGVESVSAVVGSEPGAISFGGGGATVQAGQLTVHLVDRTRRSATIWEIEEEWRQKLRNVRGIRSYRVSEYGATPVSTTKAPFDLILSGPDPAILDRLADQVIARLRGTPGLVDLRRSWYLDKEEREIVVDPALARYYGLSPQQATWQVQAAVQGAPAGRFRLSEFLDIPIRVRYRREQVADPAHLEEIYLPAGGGLVPLRSLAVVQSRRIQPVVTREDLQPTIDITGGNIELTIGQVTEAARRRLADFQLPAGYEMTFAGTVRDIAESQAEMGRALVIGIVLLYILLLAMFRSFVHPVTIMSAIPLAVAGAFWGLLLFHKPFCKPAFMGVILLGGTIVNNAILLLDFILQARARGVAKDEAILDSVRIRLRPILMTAGSTIVGFTPLIFEMAVGLERMSPLGIAAAAGLLVGTIVTTAAVPIIYSSLDSLAAGFARWWPAGRSKVGTALLVLGILLVGGPSLVRAEAPAGSLTLEQAVTYALEHHPDLAALAAAERRRAAETSVAEAERSWKIDGLIKQGWSQEPHTVIPLVGVGTQRLDRWTTQGGVTAGKLLFDFGRSEALVRSALALREAASSQLERRRQEVVFEVARAFVSVLTVEDLWDAVSASEKTLVRLLEDTKQKLEQGRAARLDVLKVQVRLAEVRSRLAELAGAREAARAALVEAMGWAEPSPPPSLVDPTLGAAGSEPPPVEAAADRPDLRALEKQVEAAREAAVAARRAGRPRFLLEGSYFVYGAPDPRAMLPGGPPPGDWEDDAVLALRLEIPLWDGGARAARRRAAEAGAREAEARRRRLDQQIARAITAARANLTAVEGRLDQLQAAVAEAEEAYRVEELKFRMGKGVMNDVLDAEATLLETRAQLREARRELLVARWALELALGRRPGI